MLSFQSLIMSFVLYGQDRAVSYMPRLLKCTGLLCFSLTIRKIQMGGGGGGRGDSVCVCVGGVMMVVVVGGWVVVMVLGWWW